MQTPVQFPIRTYRFTLTSDDTMAWCELRSDAMTLGSLTYFLWFILGAFLFEHLPVAIIGEIWSARWIATVLLAAGFCWVLDLKIKTLWRAMTARRAMRHPVHVVLNEWSDSLVESWDTGSRTITASQIGRLYLLETHLFIQCIGQLVIMPRRAFEDADDMRQFYERWDKKSAESAQ